MVLPSEIADIPLIKNVKFERNELMIKNEKGKSEFITIREAKEKYNISRYYCEKNIKNGKFECKQEGITRIKESDIIEYFANEGIEPYNSWALDLEFNESCRPLGVNAAINGFCNPEKYNFSPGFWISNCGKVFNAKTDKKIRPQRVAHNYLQINLNYKNKHHLELLHKLVALVWCPNSQYKSIVHHIDGDKNNNCAGNLIWVTKEEHIIAHRLMKEDISEYKKYILKIQKDNEWKEKIRLIPHLDFDNNNFKYYMYVTDYGFDCYKSGKEVPVTEIRGEIAC